jgi:hypothetical protein
MSQTLISPVKVSVKESKELADSFPTLAELDAVIHHISIAKNQGNAGKPYLAKSLWPYLFVTSPA